MSQSADAELAERAERWAATMHGNHLADDRVTAPWSPMPIPGPAPGSSACSPVTNEKRTMRRCSFRWRRGLRAWATVESEEEPDEWRTCFERDRDRILHSNSFRRLAGKTQVFVFPEDHQRTRLTHALEVAQVATSVARALGLNVALTEAIALGHDCGHGPGGHASEDALSPYVEGGYDHAVWGADETLRQLNLCTETLDGIRNHSWSRPAPSTPEGEVVSWADRIAYVCHDFEDASATGIVAASMLPDLVADRCGRTRSSQLKSFIRAMVQAAADSGRVGMTAPLAEALAEFRRFNYTEVYLRPASVSPGRRRHRACCGRSWSTTPTGPTNCRTPRGCHRQARRRCTRRWSG